MALKSWLPIPARSHFSLKNLPFGIISTASNATPRPATAIGEHVLDLSAFAQAGGLSAFAGDSQKLVSAFNQTALNEFAGLGRPVHREVREYLRSLFLEDTPHPQLLRDNKDARSAALVPISDVQMHLPMAIGDYTDFFAGRNHARNVGVLFRGPANALQPNYNHLPVAYHGRASSVVVSGTPIRRPRGQVLPAPGAAEPKFAPSGRLDIELEMGMFLCRSNGLGSPIPVSEADDYIFGYVLMNDWSARDIQQWEYVPLGPFNAKNFGTTISPWVVLADALEGHRTSGLENDVQLQSYLREDRKDNVPDINLDVRLTTGKGNSKVVARSSSRYLLWSWPQMVAHHTIAGCNMRVGDLLGSGTISGPETESLGSLLEQTQGGKAPVDLGGGETRKFLEDGDSVTITGWAGEADGEIVGFGECSGTISPAIA